MTAPSKYCGQTVVLATKHGKERLLGRTFRLALGATISTPPGIDTDTLGTFTGEVERIGTPREVAIRKARWGLSVTGEALGLASEGSFGPHPQIPWVASDHELLAFVDEERGIEVVEAFLSNETNYAHCSARKPDELGDFLRRALFPSHALIVHPKDGIESGLLIKGIADDKALADAVVQCAQASQDGLAHVETDMRAHVNPSRQKVIRRAGLLLARRLRSLCPTCETPGWGQTGLEKGLPCESCNAPTAWVNREIIPVAISRSIWRCAQ